MQSVLDFYYWDLKPYVDVDGRNLSGLVYDALTDSLEQCLRISKEEVMKLLNASEYGSQAEMLPLLLRSKNAIGMPVVTKAFSLDVPQEFVRVVETNGHTWLYQVDPPEDNILLKGLATVWPLMLLVLILNGYAALIVWLADIHVNSDRQFDKRFYRGFFQSYWFAYISATTVGYGDKVPRSVFGKVFAVLWILCGLSLMSSFTATMTTLIDNLASPPRSELPPLHNVEVGVLNSSIDYRLLMEKGAKPIGFSSMDNLLNALQTHSIDSVALDPMVYCKYFEKFVSKDFEYRTGITDPTVVGFIYSGNNASLLSCMKRVAFYMQHEFDEHISESVGTSGVKAKPALKIEASMFGENGHMAIMWGGILLLLLYGFGVMIEAIVRFACAKRKSQIDRDKSTENDSPMFAPNYEFSVAPTSEQKI